MSIVACSTHALAVDSALFAGPVAMLGLALWIVTRRERRRQRAGTSEPAT